MSGHATSHRRATQSEWAARVQPDYHKSEKEITQVGGPEAYPTFW